MDKNLIDLIDKFKLLVTQKAAKGVQQEKGLLTATDAFALESLDALKQPTIGRFANFIGISQPNASYKVQSLIKKGFVKRVPSEHDKRECKIELTDKYKELNREFDDELLKAARKALNDFSNEELQLLNKMLEKLNTQLDTLID